MKKILFMTLPLIILFFSCKSIPQSVEQTWDQEHYFVAAQEASDDENYDLALFYYSVYTVRFPENRSKVLAADYEIAFINYKNKQYVVAKEMFENILDRYKNDPIALYFDPRYKILSEKILNKMNAKNPTKEKNQEKTTT